jgi:hypothetical protein
MSGATCPSCGVAVVPGYVRCPKCRKPLPQRPSAVEGGTAVEAPSRNGPVLIGLAAVVLAAGGAIAYFATKKDKPAATSAVPTVQTDEPDTNEPDNPNTPDLPTGPTPVQPTGPNATDVAAELERGLKKQRLWSTVEVTGGRVDVRSGSCNDPAMVPMLDGAAPSFKAAGLTKLRCVEQSGRVVTDRDL